MSKTMSIFVITLLVSIAATTLTFFIGGQNTKISCFEPDIKVGVNNPLTDEIRPPDTASSDTLPVYAAERGFPFKYYHQAFPSNCLFNDGAPAPTSPSIDAGHLALDVLIWFSAALAMILVIRRAGVKL